MDFTGSEMAENVPRALLLAFGNEISGNIEKRTITNVRNAEN